MSRLACRAGCNAACGLQHGAAVVVCRGRARCLALAAESPLSSPVSVSHSCGSCRRKLPTLTARRVAAKCYRRYLYLWSCVVVEYRAAPYAVACGMAGAPRAIIILITYT